jgi:hypothetical protein
VKSFISAFDSYNEDSLLQIVTVSSAAFISSAIPSLVFDAGKTIVSSPRRELHSN